MSTEERLQNYYPFSPEITELVAEVAERQNNISFRELAKYYGIADGPQRKQRTEAVGDLEYLRFTPSGEHDPKEARVYMAPMSTPADENMAMHALRFFAADPTTQLYVIGAPAYAGRGTNKLSAKESAIVSSGDLSPVTASAFELLKENGVESISPLGYSYGAVAAAALAARADRYGMSVDRGVFIEPAAIMKRPVLKLLASFMKSADQLDAYVGASDSAPFIEAREMSDAGIARYSLGLARMSNIAIAHALARPIFFNDLHTALEAQPAFFATQAWGGKSEIVPTIAMLEGTSLLKQQFPGRTEAFMIPSGHHALADDIDLHAAILLHGLRKNES